VTTLGPVTFLSDDVTCIDRGHLKDLSAAADASATRRARYCLHSGHNDPVQEMVIAMCRDSLVRPHQHPSRAESLCVIDGCAVLIVFDGNGQVTRRTMLGDDQGTRFVRYASGVWHTLIPITDVVIVHEVTQGPFDNQGTTYASWSPVEDAALRDYLQALITDFISGVHHG